MRQANHLWDNGRRMVGSWSVGRVESTRGSYGELLPLRESNDVLSSSIEGRTPQAALSRCFANHPGDLCANQLNHTPENRPI